MDVELAVRHRAQVEEFRRRHRTGLLTLLFTDIVGSTQIKQALGDHEGSALIQQHRAVVRGVLRDFKESEEIETAGDSFFIVFVKPSDAVKFSLLLQARLRELAPGSAHPVRLRIGIHIGEVVIEEHEDRPKLKDLYGIQVDICSRVTALAAGDQVLMTRSAFDNARQVLKGEELTGLTSLQWLNHGSYVIKGLEESVEICEVGEEGLAHLKAPADGAKAQRKVSAEDEPVLGWRPAVGQVVPNSQWQLEEKLGEGGFGEVWLGRHQKLKEKRVFKFCFRADRVRSLKRELTLFRVLKERIGNHPNIVGVQEVFFDQPPYFIMMDYAEGQDLRRWQDAQSGLAQVPLATRLEIAAQVADALQAAHDAGIIHRDVKPSNIIVCGSKEDASSVLAKLTDFGIGQVVSAEALAGMTKMGFTQTMLSTSMSSLSGTQLYMAPELIAGKPASTRSDIYSLGVVLYQLVIGDLTRPLTVDWEKEIADPFLREDLVHCFAGNPQDRFAGSAQLAKNLRCLEERRTEQQRQRAAERRRVWQTAGATAAALILIPLCVLLAQHFVQRHDAERARLALGSVYDRMTSYQDTAEITENQELNNSKVKIGYSSALAMVKPARFRLSFKINAGQMNLECLIISDGKQLWDIRPLTKKYSVVAVTNSFTAALNTAREADGLLMQLLPALNLYQFLLNDSPKNQFAERAANTTFLAAETVDGQRAYVFGWNQEVMKAQLKTKAWVSKNDGIIRQMWMDLSPLYAGLGRPIKAQVLTETHQDIRLNAALDESLFTYKPSADAKAVAASDLDEDLRGSPNSDLPRPMRAKGELAPLIAPRDPGAGPELIDLTAHYNSLLTDISVTGLHGNDLSSLPNGVQTLAGVHFDIRAMIQLTGYSGPLKLNFPESVAGIKLGRKFRQIHFLHGTGMPESEGAPVAKFVLHYADGQQRELPILYGRDVRDWWWHAGEPVKAALAQIAWTGTNAASRPRQVPIRLFKSAWTNPIPEGEVTTIDYVSAMSRCAPFLIAISLDPPPEGNAQSKAPAAAAERSIDLCNYFNDSLSGFWGEDQDSGLAMLRRGTTVLAGTTFDVRGIVHLSSRPLKLLRSPYPERIEGIPVRLKCQQLHFLHASHWAIEKDGLPVGKYIVHFANGQEREIPIVYGQDVRDWFNRERRPAANAVLAWTGTNQASSKQGLSLQLFKSTWRNPTPGVEIATFDYVSAMEDAAPFLIAVTAEP